MINPQKTKVILQVHAGKESKIKRENAILHRSLISHKQMKGKGNSTLLKPTIQKSPTRSLKNFSGRGSTSMIPCAS